MTAAKFPTSEEIYNRLRFDSRFDVGQFRIVYSVRPSGTKAVAYREFEPGGRVPWHCIVEFRMGERVVWSRPERIDCLDEAVAAPIAAAGRRVAAEPRPAPPLTPSRARAPSPRNTTGGERLRVLVWNVLFAKFDAAILRSEERWAAVISTIEAIAPDVAVLVEVTPPFLAMLFASKLPATYSVSDSPTGASVAPHGTLILTRLPIVSCAQVELARGRKVVIAILETPHVPIGVATVHLPSDRAAHSQERRGRELASLFGHLASETSATEWIVAGDFNFGEDEQSALLESAGAIDAWRSIRPGDPGLTFDIEKNALAATLSSSGRSGRFDRILSLPGTRAPSLRARDASLIGVDPIPGTDRGLFPSDHFGLLVELAPSQAGAELASSMQTAATVLLPDTLLAPIQRLRARFDPAYDRWPPHVNLLFPFVEAAGLDDAARRIASIVQAWPPFDVTLDQVARLEHASGETIALEPKNPSALRALRDAVASEFPALAGRDSRLWRPHLTLGRTVDSKRLLSEAGELPPMSFRVDRVSLLSRDDGPFRIAHVLNLSKGKSPSRSAAVPANAPDLREIETALLEFDATVQLFGSALYAPSLPGRDVDLLVKAATTTDRPALLATLREQFDLRDAGSGEDVAHLRGDSLDVLVTFDEGRTPAVVRALRGPADGAALRDTLARHGRREAFAALLARVREWTHARAIGSQSLGFPGLLAWAVLAASPLLHDARLDHDTSMKAWLEWLDALPETATVSLRPDEPEDPHTPHRLRVLAPAAPHIPLTRTLTRWTEATLRAEIRRAVQLARSKRTLDLLYRPLEQEPPRGTVLEITGPDDESKGRYSSRFLSLLAELERATKASVRPWRIDDGVERWRQRISIDANVLAARDTLTRWLGAECPAARLLPPDS